jgi:hypothetical protein
MSALNLSDSIEQDYVVVINPFKPDIAMARRHAEQLEGSSSHSQSSASTRSNLQQQQEQQAPPSQQQQQQQGSLMGGVGMVESICTASGASSGSHANSSATMSAAVAALEGQPVPSGSFKQQQQQAALSVGQGVQHPGPSGGVEAKAGRQGIVHGSPGVAAVAAVAASGGDRGAAGAAQGDWVGKAPTSLRGTASELLQLQQSVNKVQLLAQVLRGIMELLQHQQEVGHEGVVPLQQQAEGVALRLFALQLLNSVCIPQQQSQQQQQEKQEGVPGQQEKEEPGAVPHGHLRRQEQPGSDLRMQLQGEVELSDAEQLLQGPSNSHCGDVSAAFGAAGDEEFCQAGALGGAGAGDLLSTADPQDLQLLMASALQLLQLLQSAAQEGQGGGAQSLFGSILKQRTQGEGPGQLLHQIPASPPAAGGGGEDSGHQSMLALAAVSDAAMCLVLPDPWQVLYQHALSSSRSAAVEELMGNWPACISSYSLAADLLMFLAVEWGELGGLGAGLSWGEKVRVHGLYAAVYGRLMLCLREQGERST